MILDRAFSESGRWGPEPYASCPLRKRPQGRAGELRWFASHAPGRTAGRPPAQLKDYAIEVYVADSRCGRCTVGAEAAE